MTNLKQQFETTKLDELCASLTTEIAQLETADYKLKLALVLSHIIEESQKALGKIDTTQLLENLRERIQKACEKPEKDFGQLVQRFAQDKQTLDALDGSAMELRELGDEIASRLARYEQLLKTMVAYRSSISLAELEQNKQR